MRDVQLKMVRAMYRQVQNWHLTVTCFRITFTILCSMTEHAIDQEKAPFKFIIHNDIMNGTAIYSAKWTMCQSFFPLFLKLVSNELERSQC